MEKKLPLASFLALAAIGWADGSLQRIEREGLARAATACGIPGNDLATWFAALDGVISTSEHETMVRIGDKLGLDAALRARAAAAANDIACLPGAGRPDRYDFVKLVERLRERLPQLAGEG